MVHIFYINDSYLKSPLSERLLSSANPILKSSINNQIIPSEEYQFNLESIINANFPTEEYELAKIIDQNYKKINKSRIIQSLTLYQIRVRIIRLHQLLKNKSTDDISPSEEAIVRLNNNCNTKCKPIVAYIPSNLIFKASESEYIKILKKKSSELGLTFIDSSKEIGSDILKNYDPKGGIFPRKVMKRLAD